MSLCDEQPNLKEMLRLLISAQLVQGHRFFLFDLDSPTPEPTIEVDDILEAICGERPLIHFLPDSQGISNDTESDTCDNG